MHFSVFNISFARHAKSYNLKNKHQTAKKKCNHNNNEIKGNNPNLVPKQVNDISALRIESLVLLYEGEIPTSDDAVE